MNLDGWKKSKDDYTALLSDVNRKLAFAGIATIWIFKTTIDSKYGIPHELIKPVIFFVISLGFDFFQYFYLAIVWTLFFKYHEWQKRKNPDKEKYKKDDIKASPILPNLAYILFFLKVISCIFGYVYLLKYLFHSLIN